VGKTVFNGRLAALTRASLAPAKYATGTTGWKLSPLTNNTMANLEKFLLQCFL